MEDALISAPQANGSASDSGRVPNQQLFSIGWLCVAMLGRGEEIPHVSFKAVKSWFWPDVLSLNLSLRCNESACITYESPELSEEIKSILDQASVWGIEVFNPSRNLLCAKMWKRSFPTR